MYIGKWSGVVVAVLIAFFLALGGCGLDFDDDDDDLVVPAVPLVFTESTAVEAARVAAGAVDIFPDLSNVILSAVGPLVGAGAAAQRTAALVVDLGDVDLCFTGTSNLTWDDADNSGDLSADDTADLVFTACDLDGFGSEELDGTISFAFTAVTLPSSATARVTAGPGLVITDILDPGTETLTMNLGLQVTQTGLTTFTMLYGDPTFTLMDTIQLVDDTGASVQFGCFDVIHTLDTANLSQFTLAPRGIVNFGGFIMQLGIYPGASVFDVPLNFTGLFPNSGTITLLNADRRPFASPPLSACAAVNSSGAEPLVISAERITATGGGDVSIQIFDDFELTTPSGSAILDTWFNLLD